MEGNNKYFSRKKVFVFFSDYNHKLRCDVKDSWIRTRPLNVLNHIRLWDKDMTWCNTAEKTWTLNLTEWQHRLLHMNVRLDLKKREALTHLWFCRNKLLFWWLVPRWLRGRLKARHAGSDWSPPLGLLGSGDRSAAAAWYLWSLITACRCSC